MSGQAPQQVFDTVRIPMTEPSTFNAGRFRSGANDVNRKYLNCFPVNNGQQSWIQGREAILALTTFDLSATLGAVTSNCFYNIAITQLSDIYVAAIYDSTNSKFVILSYSPTATTVVKIGQITGASATDFIYLTEVVVGTTPSVGVVWHNLDSTDSAAYYASTTAGVFTASSLTQITDTDFPSEMATPDHLTGPMVQLNRTFYVMGKTGKIYNSDISPLGQITSWNGLGVADAAMYPDQGIGLTRYKHMLIAFKVNTTEFWWDAGNAAPATPLSRTDQAFINMGCMSPKSFTTIDDTVYWIGRSVSGTAGLYKLDGYSPVKISGQDEDTMISNTANNLSSGVHYGRLWPISLNGKKNLVIGLASSLGNGLGSLAGQSFSGDTNSLNTTSDIASAQLMMTVEDNQFWLFNAAFNTATQKFFPMFSGYFGSGQAKSNDQYAIGAFTSVNTTSIGQNVFKIPGSLTNSTFSSLEYSSFSDSTGSAISFGVQLNETDFGSFKRKRVHRVSLIQRGLNANGFAAHLWMIVNKNQNQTAGSSELIGSVLTRSIVLPVLSEKISFPNLGIGRSWTFTLITKGINPIAWEALEVDLSLGTS